MDDFRAGALSIFDADEPTGEVTDHFPIENSQAAIKGSDE
jgi:hypothetical protein